MNTAIAVQMRKDCL